MSAIAIQLTVFVSPEALTRINQEYGLDLTGDDLAYLLVNDLRQSTLAGAAGEGFRVAVTLPGRSRRAS